MLTENDVVEAVCRFLTEQGFRIVQRLSTTERGDDIVAERAGAQPIRIAVEAKGATSARATSARFDRGFNSAQVNVHVAEAVYRALVVLSRDGSGTRAGIALPATTHHKRRVQLVRKVLDSLDVAVLWVDDQQKVICDAGWIHRTPNQGSHPRPKEGATEP